MMTKQISRTIMFFDGNDKSKLDSYGKAIIDHAEEFIYKDKYDKDVSNQVYEVLEYRLHFSLLKKPYCYCWIKILDSKAFYNGKNKVHDLYCKNPIGHNPDYIKYQLDVKEF